MAFYWRKFSGASGSGNYSGDTLNKATLQAVVEEEHWVQQTVMGVLRWRESSSASTSSAAAGSTATMTRNNSSNGGAAVPMNRHSIEVCYRLYMGTRDADVKMPNNSGLYLQYCIKIDELLLREREYILILGMIKRGGTINTNIIIKS